MPRVRLEGTLPNEVLYYLVAYTKCMPQKRQNFMCTVHALLGGSHANTELSALVSVPRHKTFCMHHLSYCILFVFVFVK